MPKQPLVVLMVEDNEHDIFATPRAWRIHHIANYNLHVNAYIRKPIGFHRFAETLRIINLFWEFVELPE